MGGAMAGDYRNTAEDLASGVKTGINAAKEIKQIASAAGKAAAGNFAGAAVDAARSDFVRTTALFLLICMGFVMFCAVFLFPMALFEAIAELIEQWKVDFYSGSDGRFVSFFKATGNLIMNVINRIISEDDDDNTDTASEADVGITSNQGDLDIVYARKIKAAKDKVTARQKTVIDRIKSEAQYGQIASIMYGRFLDQFGGSGFEYDVQYIPETDQIASAKVNIYDGTQIMATNRSITDMQALELLCLHTAQKNGDLANIKLSAFMKWLGYNGMNSRRITFPLGDNEDIRFSIRSWTGGFIPQYLEDEAAERGRAEAVESRRSTSSAAGKAIETMTEKYEKMYGASVADMLIQVNCPNLYSIKASVSEELKTDAGYGTRWIQDYSRPIYGEPSEDNIRPIIGYEMKEIEYTYDITYIHVKYTIPITVRCRDLDGLLKMAGLWKGALPWDAAPADSGDSVTAEEDAADRWAA